MFQSEQTMNKIMTDTATTKPARGRKPKTVPSSVVADRLDISVGTLSRLRSRDPYGLGAIPVKRGHGGGYTAADARTAVSIVRQYLRDQARSKKAKGKADAENAA